MYWPRSGKLECRLLSTAMCNRLAKIKGNKSRYVYMYYPSTALIYVRCYHVHYQESLEVDDKFREVILFCCNKEWDTLGV